MTGPGRAAFGAAVMFAVLWLVAGGPAGRAADAPALTPAQTLLFATDHLAAIDKPATLDYDFRHDGVKDWQDKVALTIGAVHADGTKDVSIAFLTGARHVDFPAVRRFHGNPLIMYFLEWDVRAMQRATGGSALYFRNRIRNAFAAGAEIGKTSITFAGHAVPASAVVLHPYRDDPDIARYAAFRDKSYRFVLSDRVPGMVWEIVTSLPAVGGAPARGDRVVFKEMRQ